MYMSHILTSVFRFLSCQNLTLTLVKNYDSGHRPEGGANEHSAAHSLVRSDYENVYFLFLYKDHQNKSIWIKKTVYNPVVFFLFQTKVCNNSFYSFILIEV